MTLIRINAAAAIDAVGTCVSQASMLIECQDATKPVHEAITLSTRGPLGLVRVAEPASIDALLREKSWSVSRVVERPNCVLTPAFVNAHTHLDLTHIGPRAFDPAHGFTGFIKVVLANRLTEEAAIVESIQRGVVLSLKGGVVAVGDIGGVVAGKPSLLPLRALRTSPLMGVSFLEFFGLGSVEEENLAALDRVLGEFFEGERGGGGGPEAHPAGRNGCLALRIGLQPHAPYTASPRSFQCAAAFASKYGLSLCTHLAETPEEREFIKNASGPFRSFLERVGWWPTGQHAGSVSEAVGKGLSPVAYFAKHLHMARPHSRPLPYLLAHVNAASDADIGMLAAGGHSVVYSPRSSHYFRNHDHFGPHRYRDMLKAGINVCLGTDSVINLPSDERISTLDEMRFVYRRDAMDAGELLAMATVRGARGLGMDESAFTFRSQCEIAGVVAVPVLTNVTLATAHDAILQSDSQPELLVMAGR